MDGVRSVSDLPLPPRVLDLLRRPNPCVMATLAADGRPATVATWYLLEPDGWYTPVSLQGRVEPITDDVGLQEIRRLSTHDLGSPYGDRTSPRVATRLQIERWHAWSSLREEQPG